MKTFALEYSSFLQEASVVQDMLAKYIDLLKILGRYKKEIEEQLAIKLNYAYFCKRITIEK